MATARGTKVLLAVAIASFAIGCENLLGTFEVQPIDASAPEAGDLPDGAADQQTQQTQQEAGTDAAAAVVRPCEQPIDCPAVNMTPVACAIAQCIEKKCVYVAADKDGDGHPTGGCRVEGNLVRGDDCADDQPTVFPGGPCARQPDGTEITFPTGAPVGACKAGSWACRNGKPVCEGAVGPQPAENCTLKNDANCNGVPDEGCDCTPNTVGACGNVNGLPAPCMAGTRTCSPDGKWGACIGNVEPSARDCSSTIDNDCNGQADKTESACHCTGGVPQDGSAACATGQPGACEKGAWTCMPSADKQSGVFGPCVAPKPGAQDCASASDNDCNGVADYLDVGCGTPCLDPLGSGKAWPAAQKFNAGMWGCPGRRNFSARGAACDGRLKYGVCPGQTWENYRSFKGAIAPLRKYWVSEQLGWGGTGPGNCYADVQASGSCGTGSMSVCPLTVPDVDGNTCNWTGCGFGYDDFTNDYMGGCVGNDTAGTLCCSL